MDGTGLWSYKAVRAEAIATIERLIIGLVAACATTAAVAQGGGGITASMTITPKVDDLRYDADRMDACTLKEGVQIADFECSVTVSGAPPGSTITYQWSPVFDQNNPPPGGQ